MNNKHQLIDYKSSCHWYYCSSITERACIPNTVNCHQDQLPKLSIKGTHTTSKLQNTEGMHFSTITGYLWEHRDESRRNNKLDNARCWGVVSLVRIPSISCRINRSGSRRSSSAPSQSAKLIGGLPIPRASWHHSIDDKKVCKDLREHGWANSSEALTKKWVTHVNLNDGCIKKIIYGH
jgi:hypothetical protein